MRWLIACLAMSAPALSQSALDTDFEALFETSDSQSQFDAHGVTLRRDARADGTFAYSGIDKSEQGAVGCWMMISVHAAALDRKCDLSVNPSERNALNMLLGGIARFYVQNNVPVLPEGRDLASVRSAIEVLIRSERSALPEASCVGEPADFVTSFIDGLDVTADEQKFQDVLGPARLPVSNPCF